MTYGGGRWVLALGVAAAVVSLAEESRAEDTRDEVVSITFSPLHLFFPAVEFQGEYKVINGLGVSLIAGYGWPTLEGEDENGEDIRFRADVWELGTQVMGYPLRRFRSLQLGVEVMWLHLTVDDVGDFNASGFVNGFSISPLVGFKFIAGPGFTGFIQLGPAFVVASGEASDDTGAQASDDDSDVILNLNINLGWSF